LSAKKALLAACAKLNTPERAILATQNFSDGIQVSKADERVAVGGVLAVASEISPPKSQRQVVAPTKGFPNSVTDISIGWVRKNLRVEAELDTPFLFLPIWLGCGALSYFSFESEPSLRLLATLCLTVVCLVVLARNTVWPKLILTALLFGSLGAAAAKLETLRFSTVMMGSQVTTRITGILVHAEEITNGRSRLVINVQSTERPKLKFAPERIRVSARGKYSEMEAGSKVTGLVKLFSLPGPVQPSGYDFSFESYFDGVGAAGFFLGDPEFLPSDDARTITETIDVLRTDLTAHIRSIVPGETGAVVAALVTGVRGAVEEADSEALRRSGLAHIMSISGLHLALAAGVVIATIRLGLALVPAIANVWPVKKMAASAGIIMAILYCLMSGSEVATLRSTIMIIVMLGAVLVDRPAITMRNLAIAALILLAIWPHEIAGPGFQMSFAATAGLIAIYRWWARREIAEKPVQPMLAWRIFDGAKKAVIGTVLSSTVAGFATLPFSAYHFERLAPWGTLSNLLALPAISIIVMPSAVAAMVAMPIGLDGYIWPVMAWGVDFMLWLAHSIAGLGGPDATGPVPLGALLLSTLALVVFCLPQTKLRAIGFAPLLFAGALMLIREKPVIFIDENAKTVAFVTGDQLAINSVRPDDFNVKNWQRTAETEGLMKPSSEPEFTGTLNPQLGFVCTKTLCVGDSKGGLRLAYMKTGDSVQQACENADIVVQGFAGPPVKCGKTAAVITSGMLARHGAAAIYVTENKSQTIIRGIGWRDAPVTFFKTKTHSYRVEWSYPTLNRPWQTQRIFSQPARDMPPKPKPPKRVFAGTGLQGRV
jgi:ComEC/Rec2-related protein